MYPQINIIRIHIGNSLIPQILTNLKRILKLLNKGLYNEKHTRIIYAQNVETSELSDLPLK